MKLRIKGDSMRLRLSPSEMARLMGTGRVEETIHFGMDAHARLIYALERGDVRQMAVRYEGAGAEGASVTVVVPTESAREWAEGDEVGVYGGVVLATGRLEIAIEKDWACLDKGEQENADTFPNPKLGSSC